MTHCPAADPPGPPHATRPRSSGWPRSTPATLPRATSCSPRSATSCGPRSRSTTATHVADPLRPSRRRRADARRSAAASCAATSAAARTAAPPALRLASRTSGPGVARPGPVAVSGTRAVMRVCRRGAVSWRSRPSSWWAERRARDRRARLDRASALVSYPVDRHARGPDVRPRRRRHRDRRRRPARQRRGPAQRALRRSGTAPRDRDAASRPASSACARAARPRCSARAASPTASSCPTTSRSTSARRTATSALRGYRGSARVTDRRGPHRHLRLLRQLARRPRRRPATIAVDADCAPPRHLAALGLGRDPRA